MTETPGSTGSEATQAPDTTAPTQRKRATSLNTMLLADLKAMAGALAIPGAGSMKKAQLVEAIRGVQSPPRAAAADAAPSTAPRASLPLPGPPSGSRRDRLARGPAARPSSPGPGQASPAARTPPAPRAGPPMSPGRRTRRPAPPAVVVGARLLRLARASPRSRPRVGTP
ncbi:Rho termination factor N-terminal domain-containing protein [Nocardioides houyundeii]|uniref:Rho termination factor N-terminal domain-containing protein n=1 Tax=Nocardioides houyundeii TaxID=2045452 RepID=UPI001F53C569|nr:Rho termination factor N-terminal domain-containing protein [Nocardioides houyundeii]